MEKCQPPNPITLVGWWISGTVSAPMSRSTPIKRMIPGVTPIGRQSTISWGGQSKIISKAQSLNISTPHVVSVGESDCWHYVGFGPKPSCSPLCWEQFHCQSERGWEGFPGLEIIQASRHSAGIHEGVWFHPTRCWQNLHTTDLVSSDCNSVQYRIPNYSNLWLQYDSIIKFIPDKPCTVVHTNMTNNQQLGLFSDSIFSDVVSAVEGPAVSVALGSEVRW